MIFRLALLQIRSHKIRTSLIALAVVLTSVLYMTVMSIAYCIMDSYQLSLMLATGSDFHALITDNGYSLTGEDLLNEIQSAPEVSESYLMSMEYNTTADAEFLGEAGTPVIFTDSKKILPHLFITVTDGDFPENNYEILLCETLYPSLSVGNTVTFTYRGYDPVSPEITTTEKTYTVSGLYRCDADTPLPAVALYSEDIEKELALTTDIMLTFHSSFGLQERLDALTDRLSKHELPDSEPYSLVNRAYVGADLGEFFQPANMILLVSVVAVLFFAAFLLIYNIYAIGLTQDLRTFGLLRIIGTTHRQMKQLTWLQTALIGGVSLPIGLTAGYFIGFRLLSPVFMSISGEVLPHRFSPWILAVCTLLTAFTLFFSALRPLGKIRKMTPVQSVSGGANKDINEKDRRTQTNASPFRLAVSGIRRSRGRVFITSLSAMLSVLLFVIIGGLADGVIETTYRDLGLFDIDLSLAYDTQVMMLGSNVMQTHTMYNAYDVSMDSEVLDAIAELDSVDELHFLPFQRIHAEASSKLVEKAKEFLAQQNESYLEHADSALLDAADGMLTDAVIVGIPDELCRYLRVGRDADGNLLYYTGEEFYDGSHVISVSTDNPYDGIGHIDLHLFEGDILTSDSLEKSYEVIQIELSSNDPGILWDICNYGYTDGYTALFLMPLSVFEKEFSDAPVFTVLANARDGMENELRNDVHDLIEGKTVAYTHTHFGETSYYYRTTGRLDELETLQSRLFALRLTGYSLCGIIFLIGLLNMINSALTSMLLRRREFAMLETVGMTQLQLRQMLLYENSVGGVFGLVSLVISSLLADAVLTAAFGMEIKILSLPAVGVLFLLLIAGIVAAELSYRTLTSASLTERVRCE